MVNLIGKIVVSKDGTRYKVIGIDSESMYITLEGKENPFSYNVAFKNGAFVAEDVSIQYAIMDDIARMEDIAKENEKARETEISERIKKLEMSKHTVKVNSAKNSTLFIDKVVKLQNMKVYGTKAQDIYDACCRKFKWDSSKRGSFGPQKTLYTMNATPENYSVWFLAHSNWTDTGNCF